ncbi:hypothetical protein LJC07_06545, partial [Christensenellaceae bacterium OttesenSCG-928-L17]|nr:hypothetical protein [Christensenellaceae bacterium OttesenSCG-928-L17]
MRAANTVMRLSMLLWQGGKPFPSCRYSKGCNSMQMKNKTAHADIDKIFRDILPKYDMKAREGQIALCHDMYDALAEKKIALCDAGVGIGKTITYLIAAVLLVKYQPTDDALAMYYASSTTLPFVISTSSITLQHAILEEYIPFLSKVLLEHGIIDELFSGQIQKGKRNYVCRLRLDALLKSQRTLKMKPERLEAFRALAHEKDFDRVSRLSAFDRAKVCVPKQCPVDCVGKPVCLYKRYIRESKMKPALFQVCNHNYCIADLVHREKGYNPLLPHYRGIIVDEAHQFHAAVQDMCGSVVSREKLVELYNMLRIARLNTEGNRLQYAMELLFDLFRWQAKQDALYRKSSETRHALQTALRDLQDIQLKVARKWDQPRLQSLVQEISKTISDLIKPYQRSLTNDEYAVKGYNFGALPSFIYKLSRDNPNYYLDSSGKSYSKNASE